ncbi:hypothetical protein [Streptomyces fradiae]|uniref:hypothetical protein n=1 Tax=Streptomyces fradiae TaxID=1906 RepID=UPI0035BE4506
MDTAESTDAAGRPGAADAPKAAGGPDTAPDAPDTAPDAPDTAPDAPDTAAPDAPKHHAPKGPDAPSTAPDNATAQDTAASAELRGTQDAPRPARRWGRTVLLIAAAAVIGVSVGTAVGYRIQADRPPTPLPPLNQPGLAYPAAPLPKGEEPPPLTAAEDRRVKTDGDLRELLVPTPKGAKDMDAWWLKNGWEDGASYARGYAWPVAVFEDLVERDLRRIAGAAWDQGGDKETHIELLQFRAGGSAMTHAEQLREQNAGVDGAPLKGSGNGRYYVLPPSDAGAGGPMHHARAVFQRGDVVVDINIYDSERISQSEIRVLAERQLELLS